MGIYPAALNFVVLLLIGQSSADLYNSSDSLVILNNKNFHQAVWGKENAWIIQFYLSWCGHCIKFAPTWRKFSEDTIYWHHTIMVGAIDCADEENVPICKNYGVTSYPHVRLLSANASEDSMGESVSGRDANALKTEVIDFLIAQEEANTGSSTWVNLLRHRGRLENIFQEAPEKAEYAIIIVENVDSKEGSTTVMDLGSYSEIYIRTMSANDVQDQGFSLTVLPTLIVIDRYGERETLTEDAKTGKEITEYIVKFFQIPLEDFRPSYSTPVDNSTERPGISVPQDVIDQVYMVDIENTLSYALTHEVSSHDILMGERLSALKGFLDVLKKFFPARPEVHLFIVKLSGFVNKHRDTLPVSAFTNALTHLNNSESHLPAMQPWIACRGSQPKYRGYPCGFWTLAHTLTVNAELVGRDDPSYDPLESLKAIRDYVAYFFGCAECANHFQVMYDDDAETYVQNPNEEILWLWKAHNKVNKRLKGDLSEDPMHVKQPFPVRENCPACWQVDKFNEAEVLKYLKKMYGKDNLSYLGSENFDGAEVKSLSSGMKLSPWMGSSIYFPTIIGYSISRRI